MSRDEVERKTRTALFVCPMEGDGCEQTVEVDAVGGLPIEPPMCPDHGTRMLLGGWMINEGDAPAVEGWDDAAEQRRLRLHAEERADRLEAELEHWKGCNLYPTTYRTAVETLYALTGYAKHKHGCASTRTSGGLHAPGPCDCGLRGLLEKAQRSG